MTHKTKGIVLRTIQYGETSVITTVYTELFGLQGYIIKGVRQAANKTQTKQMYFQPGAILDMEVHHNELKNLQFIKEYKWAYLYKKVFFNVTRNAIAQFMIELFHSTIKQPGSNPELFYLIEGSLHEADKGVDPVAANLPLYFIVHLAAESGFQLQGSFSTITPKLDLNEGVFVDKETINNNFVSGPVAGTISKLMHIQFYNDLENIHLNRQMRQQVLDVLLQYLAMHFPDFKELKSLPVLREVLK